MIMIFLILQLNGLIIMIGYAWAEDKEHCEEYGRMLQADSSKVSPRAKKRGLPQVKYGAFFCIYVDIILTYILLCYLPLLMCFVH